MAVLSPTYTGQRNFFGTKVNNLDTTILATADDLINDHRRQILSAKQWWFLEKSFSYTTVAATQGTTLQGDIDRIVADPIVTIGTQRYQPRESPSINHWNDLNFTSYQSDTPEWWIYLYGQLLLFPIPSAGGKTVEFTAKQKVIDLSIADYTTGTITTATNASTAIVGSGTTWTAGMAGAWLQIAKGFAANLGDGIWYQIGSVGSTTTISLSNKYGGTSIAAGSATYKIGQCSILPEQYASIPVYGALSEYFTSIEPNPTQAQLYAGMGTTLKKQMDAEQSNRSGGRVLDEGIYQREQINPNLIVRG